MTAYQITPDSTVERSFPITVQGNILDKNDRTYLSLDIALADDFRYSFGSPDPDGIPTIPGMELMGGDPDDLSANTFTYDAVENKPSACNFVINAEHGYFIAHWPEEDVLVLAAKDPDVKISDLTAHFDAYIQAWKVFDSEDAFKITMYGAELDVEGNVIQRMDFALVGRINEDGYSGHDSITLEPITLGDLTLRLDYSPMLYHELSESSYYLNWLSYLGNLNRHTTIEMGLSRDMTSCMLIVEDSQTRYFVGSIDEDFDPKTILQQFDYLPFSLD